MDLLHLPVLSITEGSLIAVFVRLCRQSACRVIGVAFHVSHRVCDCQYVAFLIPGIYRVLRFFTVCPGASALCQMSHRIILVEGLIPKGIGHLCKVSVWCVLITGNVSIFIFRLCHTSEGIVGEMCHASCRVFNGYDAVKAVIAVTVVFPRRGGTPCKVSLGIIAVVLPCTVRVAHTLQPSAFFISVDGAAPVRMADAFCFSHLIIEYTGGGTCRIRDTGSSP